MPEDKPLPDTQVPDTQEDFENQSQNNATEDSADQRIADLNRKRTYDVYQDFDVQAVRLFHKTSEKMDALAVQAMQNAIETANMVGKQAVRHADVAADALWTDELNPVTRGAGDVMAGQSPVNSQLAGTASIMDAFGNITTQVVGLAQTIMQSNVAITNTNAAMVALLAQLVQNAKQTPTAAA